MMLSSPLKLLKINNFSKGVSLVEYGILVVLIAIVALVSIRTLGLNVNNKFYQVGKAVKN